ncbi:MAG: DUF4020 domain-containing protein, partial [Treponema sp.]|nr:DUF4020 domain-containing protein [Treponema sp.]
MDYLSKREFHPVFLFLFQRLFENGILPESISNFGNCRIKYSFNFVAKKYPIAKAWSHFKIKLIENCKKELLLWLPQKLLELSQKIQILHNVDNASDVPELVSIPVFEKDSLWNDDYPKPFISIFKIFSDCCCACYQDDPTFVEVYLKECFSKDDILLSKACLRALRDMDSIPPDTVFDIVVSLPSILDFGKKYETTELMVRIFNLISENRQERFIKRIEDYKKYEEDRNNARTQYWWFSKLRGNSGQRNDFNEKAEKLRNLYDFTKIDNCDEYGIWSRWTDDEPVSLSEMNGMGLEKIIDKFVDCQDTIPENKHPIEFLIGLADYTAQSFETAMNLIKDVLDRGIKDRSPWTYIMVGINDSKFTVSELLEILSVLVKNIEILPYKKGIARLLLKVVQNSENKEFLTENESLLKDYIQVIWNNRDKDMDLDESQYLITAAINSCLEPILQSCIWLLSCSQDSGIPQWYKTFMEDNLSLSGTEKVFAYCTLGGYFNFLVNRDADWTKNKFIEGMTGEIEELFVPIWTGFMYYSASLNMSTAPILEPVFLQAVKSIEKLKNIEVRQNFVRLYVLLLVYYVKNPFSSEVDNNHSGNSSGFITEFYRYSNTNDKILFLELINELLQKMNPDIKIKHWNSWVREFVTSKFDNLPTPLTEEEKNCFYYWLENVEEFFEEFISILSNNPAPKTLDIEWIATISESEFYDRFPNPTLRLLSKLLNEDTNLGDCFEWFLEDIDIHKIGLDENVVNEFKEALLHRKVDFDQLQEAKNKKNN